MEDKQVHILLVEDNPGDARLLQEILKETDSEQFVLSHTENLSAAKNLLSEKNFDVILLDLSLPDAHGLETVNTMHNYVSNQPIVVLTGTDDEELAVKAVQAGAQDYLVKGTVDNNLLVRAIRYSIERKKTEIEREMALTKASESDRLSTVGTLAAGIAHELNQPLQTFKYIISNLKYQSKKGKLSDELLGKKLDKMNQLSDYMATIITNLLGYVRPDEEYGDHLLKDILKSVISMIGKQLSKQNVCIELNISDDLSIYCNRNAVTQVFMNLFINAKDAYSEISLDKTSDTDKSISVYTELKDANSHIYVKDQAGGIPSSIRNQVFEPFISTKPAIKGTGMGLHVVHQIMAGHNGDIIFEIDEGLGTTFELVFPTAQGNNGSV